MNSFSNTLNRLKKWNFATVRGGLRHRTPCGGRLMVFKWPQRCPRKKSFRRHCKFLNQIREFTEIFSVFIGFIIFESFQIIIRKKFINSCQICSIFRRFFGHEKCLYFWKLDSFSNTLHRLKKWNFATVRGAFAPPLLDPLRGARDSH